MTESTPLGRAVAQRVRRPACGVSRRAGHGNIDQPGRSQRGCAGHDRPSLRSLHTTPRNCAALPARAAALADAGVTVDADDGVVIAGGPQETRFVALRTLAAGAPFMCPQAQANAMLRPRSSLRLT